MFKRCYSMYVSKYLRAWKINGNWKVYTNIRKVQNHNFQKIFGIKRAISLIDSWFFVVVAAAVEYVLNCLLLVYPVELILPFDVLQLEMLEIKSRPNDMEKNEITKGRHQPAFFTISSSSFLQSIFSCLTLPRPCERLFSHVNEPK
jgi:hypothetical protein